MEDNRMMDKIRKLLKLSENNENESEASSALLKAQKLMSENNISMDMSNPEKIEYASLVCEHKWDMGFRKPLGTVIARNFRCKMYLQSNSVVFMGHAFDAQVAKEAFEYAYEFALKEGNKHYNKAYSMGIETRGVFNSYVLGFIKGIDHKFSEQSVALMIIIPPDVESTFTTMTEKWKTSKGGMRQGNFNINAYTEGMQDGKTIMNGRRIASK